MVDSIMCEMYTNLSFFLIKNNYKLHKKLIRLVHTSYFKVHVMVEANESIIIDINIVTVINIV